MQFVGSLVQCTDQHFRDHCLKYIIEAVTDGKNIDNPFMIASIFDVEEDKVEKCVRLEGNGKNVGPLCYENDRP